MGEESTTPVYIGKYDDGKVVFEPLGEFKEIDHDITDVYPDDMIMPMECVRTIMRDQTITVRAFLQKKGLRGFYKAIGMPAYLRTEYLFPKKKKRGTARRKRKLRRYERNFRAFIKRDNTTSEEALMLIQNYCCKKAAGFRKKLDMLNRGIGAATEAYVRDSWNLY